MVVRTARNALLIIADENQFPPAVFLAHRLAALKGDRDVDVVIASESRSDLAKARELGGPFQLLDVTGLYADLALPAVNYFTRATYLSLFVPALLQDRYQRLLYLDVDTYPESDRVFALFDLDLGRQAIAAVRDLTVAFHPNIFNVEEITETLQVAPPRALGAKYLNSGVLLMDLRAWRRQ